MSPRRVALALQGGGSHGAFTWGVLDRLLEDERIRIEALSGASAGALNAVVLAHGMTAGGRAGARKALQAFWDAVATKALFNSVPQDLSAGAAKRDATGFESLFSLMQLFSPRQWNPMDVNPLRDILADQIDFARLRRDCPLALYVATTRVSTGMLRLFQTRDLTLEVLLASACLPQLNRAVDIEGEAYWDGGLTANPPVFPLVRSAGPRDLFLVQLQPAFRGETPGDAIAIRRRLSEISFSSAFFTEMQMLALARHEAQRAPFALGGLQRKLRNLRVHAIDSQDLMNRLSAISKLNVHAGFLLALRDEGRARADGWLAANFGHLGERSTFALERFLPLQGEALSGGPRPHALAMQNGA